jgi:hypothetical protein
METKDILTLVGFIIFSMGSILFFAGLIHCFAKYTINRLNKLK